METLKGFFLEIDAKWRRSSTHRARVRLIGSGALMLQADYERGTKDSDVFEATDLEVSTKDQLLELAGARTALHAKWRLYVDIVRNGIPFLPEAPLWHPAIELNSELRHLEVLSLDIVDVVVSKLKRFNANDRSDIDAMVERDLVSHERLLERFRSAVAVFTGDARASELHAYVENLHRVERDMLDVDETEITLPPWV